MQSWGYLSQRAKMVNSYIYWYTDNLIEYTSISYAGTHGGVIKWKHFPRYWPFMRGIHRSPVNSPHKCQQRWALMFSLICEWINGWVNNRGAGDLRRYRAHCDVTVMINKFSVFSSWAKPDVIMKKHMFHPDVCKEKQSPSNVGPFLHIFKNSHLRMADPAAG